MINSPIIENPSTFRGVVYHSTTPENWEEIKQEGKLTSQNRTRGISNRGTQAAIFTSVNPEETLSYGDVALKIDLSQLGDTIQTDLEEPVKEMYQRQAVASVLEVEPDYFMMDSSDGISESTVVVYGDIPLEYVERMD